MKKQIIALVNDMIFAAKIRGTAEALGVEVRFAKTPAAVLAQAREARPALLIVDLHAADDAPWTLAEACKNDAELQGVPLAGFFSHVQISLKQQAQAAGYDQIWPRSAFFKRLPQILEVAGSRQ